MDSGSSLVDEVFKAMGGPLMSTTMMDGRSNASLSGPTSYTDAGYDSLPSGVRTLSQGELRQPPSPDYKVPISSSIQQRRARASNGSSSSGLQLTLNSGSGTDITYGSAPQTPGSERDMRVNRISRPYPPSNLPIDMKGSNGSLPRRAHAADSPGADSPSDKDSKKRIKMLKMVSENNRRLILDACCVLFANKTSLNCFTN